MRRLTARSNAVLRFPFAQRGPYGNRTILSALVLALQLHGTTPTVAGTAVHVWSERFGSTGSEAGYSVAADQSGNLFVTGYFSGTVDFGGGGLTDAGSGDMFLAKYDAHGVHQWSKRFGDSVYLDWGICVATDPSGNVFLTGNFAGTVDFGGGPMASPFAVTACLAKFDANGVHQWSRMFSDPVTSSTGNSVATDASGDVFVTGSFYGTIDCGGGLLVTAGTNDIFLAKYDADGVYQWCQSFGDIEQDIGMSVAVDASGDVLLGGQFNGGVDFGGGVLAGAGDQEAFVAKYTSNGTHQWSKRFGDTLYDQITSVAVDGLDNVIIAGSFYGTVDFGGGGLASTGPFISPDVFLAKYDADGAHLWSQHFGGDYADYPEAIATDALGNILMTGWFNGPGPANFGGSDLVNLGSDAGYIAKYGPDGTHRWSRGISSLAGAAGFSIAADGSGHEVATGHFLGTLDFGGGGLTSAGAGDIYIAKYDAAEPEITAITDVGNDQGRRVRIHFARSGNDVAPPVTPVLTYEAYLRNDPLPSLVAREGTAYSRAELLADGWTQVASISAHAEEAYLMDATTDADSTVADGQHHSVFFVRATTASPSVFYDSVPDSGYSLDNLSPGVPDNFVYDAGQLSWGESSAPDFDHFTVYGSGTDDFGSSTVVDYTVATALDVTSSPYAYYYVTATDGSGNEGSPAVINALTGVGSPPTRYVLSISAYPNPFNPATTIRYTLPSPGRVTLVIYDARGARVAMLVDGDKEADAFTARWDGRDDSGAAVSSGAYFVRIEHDGATRSKKLVLLK